MVQKALYEGLIQSYEYFKFSETNSDLRRLIYYGIDISKLWY